MKKRKIIFLFLITTSFIVNSFAQSNEKETDYYLEYYNDLTNQKSILTYSFSKIKEIQESIPLLHIDSCIKYGPDSLYEISKRKFSEEMSIEGFGSEAGQDEFYLIMAAVMRKETDSKMKSLDSLRTVLQSVLRKLNDIFRCAAKGGTAYYHLSERIYAYSEWYLLVGIHTNFSTTATINDEKIRNRIKTVITSYDNKKAIEDCIDSLSFGKNKQYWLREQAFDFIKQYE